MTQSPTRLPAEALTDEQIRSAFNIWHDTEWPAGDRNKDQYDSIWPWEYRLEGWRAAVKFLAANAPVAQPSAPTFGMDRNTFHDKAWALYQSKALDSSLLPKLSIHAIRTLWNALYDSMPLAEHTTVACNCSGLGPCEKRTDGSCRLARVAPVAQPEGDAWVRGEEDADGNELITVRKDEWERLKGAQPAGAVPASWDSYAMDAARTINAYRPTTLEELTPGRFVNRVHIALIEAMRFAVRTHSPESADAIARSKRILALVDTYVDKQSADNRAALRHALMDEFAAPTHVPENSGGDGVVGDLVALVERLARKLRSTGQDGAIANGAMDYLRRHNLLGTPLRSEGVDSDGESTPCR